MQDRGPHELTQGDNLLAQLNILGAKGDAEENLAACAGITREAARILIMAQHREGISVMP